LKSIFRLMSYVKFYWKEASIAVLCSLLATLINLAPPWFIKVIIDDIIVNKNVNKLKLFIIGLLLIYVSRSIFVSARSLLTNHLGQKVIRNVRNSVYEHLQRLSLSYYEDTQTGTIMSKLINDVNVLQDVIINTTETLIVSVLTLIGISVILLYMNWRLALVVMIPLPILSVEIYEFSKRVVNLFRQARKKLGELNTQLQENISGVKEIKAFTQENYAAKEFAKKNEGYYMANMKAVKLRSIFSPMIIFTIAMGTLLILWLGGLQAITGTLTIGELVAFISYIGLFYQPVHELNRLNHNLQQARASAERVFGIMDIEPEISQAKDAVPLPFSCKGHVRFKNVFFNYSNEIKVLQNVNLEAYPRQIVALVGPTGTGKTTLVNLILRFYDVTKGRITIDGYDIRNLRLEDLRKQIGIVSQETFLFNGTVKENIAFGKDGAGKEKIVAVAKAANAHRFITALPKGYRTQVGERGVKLSVGEKQRISIARAILKDPPILILDEATSSVDTETEALIQEALGRLMKNRTVFVVAHRLSTTRKADEILVMNKGQIVERGTHERLLRSGKLYTRLYNTQFQEKASESGLHI